MSEMGAHRGAEGPPSEPFSRLTIGSGEVPEGVWLVADSSDLPEPQDPVVDDGVVSWFSAEEGWGAIRTDGGHDVFVHFSAIDLPGYRTLAAGQRVHLEYRPVEDQDGYRWVAEVVRVR
jgi:CspA family cold shock protein